MKEKFQSRVVVYLQDQSALNEIASCYGKLTAVNISSFHFGYTKGPGLIVPYIHLNDNVPQDPMFDNLWTTMATAQQNGILKIAMLGGAGGAYGVLFGQNNYEVFYPILRDTLRNYAFDGIDLDIEEPVTSANLSKLITDLRKDFPTNFYITAAPVCLALQTNNDPFSGLNWSDFLSQIDWFNVQFYSGYGSLGSQDDYVSIIQNGYPSAKILGGMLTNTDDGSGYVNIATVCSTLSGLKTLYNGEMGGAMGWEFFNANNASEQADPPGWAEAVKNAVS